jgi:beta-galactosidase GanA
MNDDRLLLAWAVERKYPKDGPAVIRVVISDPVYDSTDSFGDGPCWCAKWRLHWRNWGFLNT